MIIPNNNLSAPAISLALFLGLISEAAFSAISPQCGKYSTKSEHRMTCEAYDSDKIVVMQPGANLNDRVTNLQSGELLIVPAGTYHLTAPLKLKSGAGLLSATEGLAGFVRLGLAGGFSIGDDQVYCLVALGDRSRVTGIDIDLSGLTGSNELYFNSLNERTRTLVYSTGNSGFTITWSSLVGRLGMDAPILARNADNRTNITGGTYHTIRRTWIESNGALHAVVLDTAKVSDASKKENVSITKTAVKISKMDMNQEKQAGVHVKNGCGEIRKNYLVFDASSQYNDQIRTGVTIEDVDGTEVSGNIFYSQEKLKRNNDAAFAFFESSGVTISATVAANAVSDKMVVGSPENTASGLGIQTTQSVYRQKGVPFFLARDTFFKYVTQEIDASLSPVTGSGSIALPDGGVCLAAAYAMQNLTETEDLTGDEDIWHHVCGVEVERSEYNLPMAFNQAASCPRCDSSDNTGWVSATALSCTGLGISAIVNIGLILYYCVWVPHQAAKAAASGDVEKLTTEI